MTQYAIPATSGTIAAFTLTDGTPLTIKKINGVDVDWPSQTGGLYEVTTSHGKLLVPESPLSTDMIYDDEGTTDGHPQIGHALPEGSFTCTRTNGITEYSQITVALDLSGIATSPPPAPLVNTVAPVISGTTAISGTLTRTTDAVWAGETPIGVDEYWTADGVQIPGEVGTTFDKDVSFAGQTIRWQSDATDANGGMATAVSNGITLDPVSLVNITLPSFTGPPTEGTTVTRVPSTWTGNGTVDVTLEEWLIGGSPVSGQTGNTFTIPPGTAGQTLQLTDTATDDTPNTDTATSVAVTIQSASAINATVLISNVDDQFASDPEFGWTGFSPSDTMTVQTATHPDQVKALWDSWAAGTPSTSKLDIVCDWNGLLANSQKDWVGPAAAKLTSDPSALWGYNLGTGGVRLRAAPGKRPVFDQRLNITGLTRLEIDGVHFAGNRDGITTEVDQSIRFMRSSARPTLGLIALKNISFGHYDNRGPSLVQADVTNGFRIDGGKSLYMRDIRMAGLNTAMLCATEYFDADRVDFQQVTEDHFSFRNYTGAMASRTAWIRIKNVLIRDSKKVPTGLHPDFCQLGLTTDSSHTNGYRYAYKQILGHLQYDLNGPVNQGSQGAFHAQTPGKFEGGFEEGLLAINAYIGFQYYDPTGTGHNWLNRVAFYRAGTVAQTTKSYPKLFPVARGQNGGSLGAENCTIHSLESTSPGLANIQLSSMRYSSPLAGVPAGRTGLSASQAQRFEEVVTGTGGSIDRSGADLLTYTIPGETDPDSNVAFAAMRDFYTPVAGWGSAGQPNDPMTWVGSFGDY